MKKIIVALFVVVTAFAFTLQAFAASGKFVSSPSGKAAPELVESTNENEACSAEVIICAYYDRDTLNDADKAKLEAAYASIVNASDLADLNGDLASLAESLQISSDKLSVSDLFNVGYSDCAEHDAHGKFSVTIKPTVIDNFACLMQYDGSAWALVEDVLLDEETATLTFDMVDRAPYAIVVHDGSAVIPAVDDGGSALVGILVGVGLAVAAAAVVVFVVYKKKKKKEQ